ncbi:hypothetical protein K4L06_00965 [Lysobacter sp. BMK333-48F3]|uniref:hypothetical protein n=1 Tax=Lysobacter sp. BMK333-48F3 TaxID=2867962 RepID=UPI001C8C2034|nr:hypothetical protein [Lysobacter sp. BMK333-48F3]MBX9399864.1 hypothetical protein [Lysobacter sp. BMK333-48F3]
MSISASIDMDFVDAAPAQGLAWVALPVLIDAGWRLEPAQLYLPLGDKEDFDWRTGEMTVESLAKQKAAAGEWVGVSLVWEESGIGGNFVFEAGNTMFVSLCIHRRSIGSTNLVDFNWYAMRILTPLPHVLKVSSYRCDVVYRFSTSGARHDAIHRGRSVGRATPKAVAQRGPRKRARRRGTGRSERGPQAHTRCSCGHGIWGVE